MKKENKKFLCEALTCSMILSLAAGVPVVSEAKAVIAKKKITMRVGEKKQIELKKTSGKAKYSFSSSSKKKATVSKKGVIKALKTGKVYITVKETLKKKPKTIGKVTVTIEKKKSASKDKTKQTVSPGVQATASTQVTSSAVPTTSPTAAVTKTPRPTNRPTPTPFPENPEFNNIPRGYTAKVSRNCGTTEYLRYKTKVYYKEGVSDEEKEEITRYAIVVLPKDYSAEKEYPVLYYLHGFSDSPQFNVGDPDKGTSGHGDQYVIWNAAANGDSREIIAVYACTSCDERETFPEVSGNTGSVPGYDYVINDVMGALMENVNKTYSVAKGRENMAIVGFSMGGREAMNIGLRNIDKFCAFGGFAPAFIGDFNGSPAVFPVNEVTMPEEYKDSTYIQITKGAEDFSPGDYLTLFDQKGIKYSYYETMGGDPPGTGNGTHWKHVWQHGLYNFLKRAFPVKTEQS